MSSDSATDETVKRPEASREANQEESQKANDGEQKCQDTKSKIKLEFNNDNSTAGDGVEEDESTWKVSCSDEESFYSDSNNYRMVNGKKIWEPKVEDIISLYSQLEHKGFIELKWQCPGRRSPSVHSAQQGGEKKQEPSETNKTLESNEFDFEDDFGGEMSLPPSKSVNQSRKRLNQGKRSQTSLNKVMQDMKKYQIQSTEQQENS